MKNKASLKVFLLSQPLLNTEWPALQSDKYRHATSFDIEIVQDLAEAEVIAWDGIMAPKTGQHFVKVLDRLVAGAILLLQGEGRVLLKNHAIIKQVDSSSFNVVDLPGWNILPEEMILALETCYQKLKNV